MRQDNLVKVVREHYAAKMDEAINRLAAFATYDLHFGPYGAGKHDGDDFEYPGWDKAADTLKAWAETNLGDLWIGEDSDCVCESEPDGGYTDEHTGEWIEDETYSCLSLKQVAQALWNRELVNHIWA